METHVKAALTRAGGLLALLGGIAGLTGFVALPFAQNPETISLKNGIQLLQAYARTGGIPSPDDRFTNALCLSEGVLWAMLILFVLLALSGLLMTVARRHGMLLPLLCLLFSLAAGISLFLMCSAYRATYGGDLLILMFAHNPPFTPIIGPGWWVCASALLLTLNRTAQPLRKTLETASRLTVRVIRRPFTGVFSCECSRSDWARISFSSGVNRR